MVEVTVAYDVYPVEKNRGRRVIHRLRWRCFSQTCHRVARWSARKELYADGILRGRLDLFNRAGTITDQEWLEMPAHQGPAVYADPRRHYRRMASVVHMLTQLASVPDLIFGDYESLFVEYPRWAGEFLAGGHWFAPLQPECWPEHPAVPPFVVSNEDFVFSPVPLKGARPALLNGPGRPPPTFRYLVDEQFVEGGGWRRLNPQHVWRY